MIITKFAPNGSLENFLTKNGNKSRKELNYTQKLIVIFGIASAMKFLHSHEIIHRDLKPENFLIDETFLPKIADNGDIESLKTYADMNFTGDGILVNKREALKYYKIAADEGDSDAILEYTIMLERGDGCLSDIRQAMIYYKKAVDKGNTVAMYRFASLLMADKKQDESLKYLKMSADNGYIVAIKTYASMKKDGDRCTVDKEEALKYYKIAADKGEVDEMIEYAKMIDIGDGVAVNKEEAMKYYKMAADKGSFVARRILYKNKNIV